MKKKVNDRPTSKKKEEDQMTKDSGPKDLVLGRE